MTKNNENICSGQDLRLETERTLKFNCYILFVLLFCDILGVFWMFKFEKCNLANQDDRNK